MNFKIHVTDSFTKLGDRMNEVIRDLDIMQTFKCIFRNHKNAVI